LNPLRDHQVAAIQKALPVLRQQGGFYLDMGVGSGKTLTAITLARLLEAKRVLVVVGPVVALGVWRNELAKWWPDADAWEVQRFVRTGMYQHFVAKQPVQVQTINADRLDPNTVKVLVKWKPDLLVGDEQHFFKTPAAQRTRAFWKLAAAAKYKVLMSGTPAHNLLDYWAQYRVIDSTIFPRTFGEYKREVAILGGPNGNWLEGFKPGAKEEVARKIAPYTYHFDTKDLHLPEPIYTDVPVTLYPEERTAYAAMDKDFWAELGTDRGDVTSASTALVKAMRLHQLSSGHATNDSGQDVFVRHSAKLDALLELLKDRSHQKVVVACRFLSEIGEIARAIIQSGHHAGVELAVIHGDVSAKNRERILDDFQRDARPWILLIQYKSGGISADMTAADALILYSLEPSSIAYRQTIGRVWRMGQTGHVQIITLLAENTVDGRLLDGLKRNLDSTDLGKYLMEEQNGATTTA
jgi:SNF2 family DNA or RNA helicase